MTNPKFLIVAITIMLIVTNGRNVFAQGGSVSHKIDEFSGEVDEEDLMARLDNFAIELMNQPDAQGHIIVYRSRRDASSVSRLYALRAKDYLVSQRGIDRNKLLTIDGGMSGCLTYELWIVPPGGSLPERRFTYKYPLKSRSRGKS